MIKQANALTVEINFGEDGLTESRVAAEHDSLFSAADQRLQLDWKYVLERLQHVVAPSAVSGGDVTVIGSGAKGLKADSGLCGQARPLKAFRGRCSRVHSRRAQQQIARTKHHVVVAHWVWLRHHRLPENIRVFSTAQTARYRPFCARKKENGDGLKSREEEEGKSDTSAEEEANWTHDDVILLKDMLGNASRRDLDEKIEA
ncbi:hypothetical protein NQZ68_002354, partial [Dissostichus eleginoides]